MSRVRLTLARLADGLTVVYGIWSTAEAGSVGNVRVQTCTDAPSRLTGDCTRWTVELPRVEA